jgi:hypothetical protein
MNIRPCLRQASANWRAVVSRVPPAGYPTSIFPTPAVWDREGDSQLTAGSAMANRANARRFISFIPHLAKTKTRSGAMMVTRAAQEN